MTIIYSRLILHVLCKLNVTDYDINDSFMRTQDINRNLLHANWITHLQFMTFFSYIKTACRNARKSDLSAPGFCRTKKRYKINNSILHSLFITLRMSKSQGILNNYGFWIICQWIICTICIKKVKRICLAHFVRI